MSQAGTPHQCKILFIDDSQTEINYLKLLFQFAELPADAVFIKSAEEALEVLASYAKENFPDFIIVDINMPLMDGFQFTDQYLDRFKNKFPDTKLYIYSTSLHSKDVARAEAIDGVKGYINKPFDESTFNQRILPFVDNADTDNEMQAGETQSP